ncbi:MAG: 16S rRNA (cytosine(967)-C(5))-methyltransferase [Pelodictyon luteolum]|uniref:16S rRNA (cytosine(967)-C(5))-methyltransferase n=1 Tax=Pelodictyon luteolum TaxID=1100 RepID=A0A165LBS7_PELLU|nr:16S rRNA (cytosine(967)-C(5))-methyltransferase RsmB [Pelodictyon luteolum]KZK73828.1 MAG: 16S rRNA (cytosine(967)-C(5))-methyltransferase [Pelodictyon luteolum]
MTSARELAFNILQQLEAGTRHSDSLLHELLEASSLKGPDRALTTALTSGVLRQRLQLDFIISKFYSHDIKKASPAVLNILRLGVWQLLFLDRVPRWAAVNECVRLARRYKGDRMSKLTNAVLRKISPETIDFDLWLKDASLSERLSVLHSHPEPLVRRWIGNYGEQQAESMLRYDNGHPLFGIRHNPLKGTDGKGAEGEEPGWQESGIPGIRLAADFHLFEPLLRQGLASVQNPTQALAVLLLDPRPDWKVLDLCAAPGGKAAHAAELMGNRGEIIALDRYPQKTLRIQALADTLGMSIIEARTGDAREFTPPFQPDAILVDAPCTGSGVLGRRSELRWKTGPEKLRELSGLQEEILRHAAGLLAEGGLLLYSTCSVEPEENQLQIEAFLQQHPAFRIEQATGKVPEPFCLERTPEGGILTLPGARPGFDGGYAVLLRKQGG